MEYLKELQEFELELRKSLADMLVHIDNLSYESLLNMSILDRNMILSRYNKKVEKMNGK